MTSSSLRVLGIDPGLTRCGLGVVDVDRARRGTLVHVEVIRSSPVASIGERLAAVAAGVRETLERLQPDAVAVERVFAQQNNHTVMGTAQASGVALLLASEAGLPAAMHTPSEVKAAVTGYGSADKRQVKSMIARILRLDAPPQPADAADALAIALCHAWRRGSAPASGGSALTPAQRTWDDAERVARTYLRPIS